MHRLKIEKQTLKKYQADPKEARRKAAGNGELRCDGKQQRMKSPAVAAASKPAVRIPVEGCWHYKGPHLNINCPQKRRGKQ